MKGVEMSNEIKVYISHSIRGKMGNDATKEYMDANNKKAIAFGGALSKEFPNIDFHVPGAYEGFVGPAYRKGHLTEKQILDIDCDIISNGSFIIVFSPDDFISKGMKVEIDYAVKHSIPIISAVDGSDKEYFNKICYGINCHLTSMMR